MIRGQRSPLTAKRAPPFMTKGVRSTAFKAADVSPICLSSLRIAARQMLRRDAKYHRSQAQRNRDSVEE